MFSQLQIPLPVGSFPAEVSALDQFLLEEHQLKSGTATPENINRAKPNNFPAWSEPGSCGKGKGGRREAVLELSSPFPVYASTWTMFALSSELPLVGATKRWAASPWGNFISTWWLPAG